MGVCGEDRNINKVETNKLKTEVNQDLQYKIPTKSKKRVKSKVNFKTKSDLKIK